MQGPVITSEESFSQFAIECASRFFGLGRRGVSSSGGNCISAAAASSYSLRLGRILTAASVVLMCATAAVSVFGCYPVAVKRARTIDFVSPNPDIGGSPMTARESRALPNQL